MVSSYSQGLTNNIKAKKIYILKMKKNIITSQPATTCNPKPLQIEYD